MSENSLLKRGGFHDLYSHIYRIIAVILIVASSFSYSKAQNFTRPNIESPSGLQVNSFIGNLFYQRSDFYLPGRGLSVDITFSYNSSERDHDWGFGFGWTFTYNQLYIPDSTGKGVIFYRHDGRKDHFEYNGTSYVSPKGIFDVLTEYTPGKYKLTAKNGTQYLFDDPAHRKLTRIIDRNGNEINLSYSGANLATITDASNRTISFIWTTGKLTEIRAGSSPFLRTIKYDYDGAANLVAVKDPAGGVISYTYGAGRVMNTLTDANHNTSTITYYNNSAVSKLLSCQLEQIIAYNIDQKKTYVTERGQGKTISTTYSFDPDGRLIARTGNCCGYKNNYSYDQDNNIASITDANGNTTHYLYDKKGNLLSETDALSQSLFYTYENQFNQVATSTDKSGNKTSFNYDGNGNLLEVVYPLSITNKFTYDSYGNRLSATDAKGYTSDYTYNNFGYLTTSKDASSGSANYTYDPLGNVSSMTDAEQNKTFYYYDSLNRLASENRPLKAITKYSYDGNGNRLTITDANGNTTTYRYNENDKPILVTNALNITTSVIYDAFSNITSGIDANGHTTRLTYDNLNRLVSSTNAAGERTSFEYDGNGNRTATLYPNGNIVRVKYDVLNRVTETSDKDGLISSYEYDRNSNLLSERDANGHTVTNQYDALNRLISKSDPTGNSYVYEYDANSNLTKERDRNGIAMIYTYDSLNRQHTAIDTLNHLTTYRYNQLGDMLSVTDARGNQTQYSYDSLSRKTQEKFADNTTKNYSFDPVGNLLSRKDNKGEATTYIYDKENRLTTRVYPTATETFTYDSTGLMRSATNNNAAVVFIYDAVSRLQSENLNGKTTSYTYDIANGIKTITYPGGRIIRRQMDERNRLKAILEGSGALAEFSYDAVGQMTERKYANNTSTAIAYNSMGRVSELTNNPNRSVDMAYTYDQEGNPLSAQFRHHPSLSEQYSYDPLNQLTGFKKGSLQQSVYNFDGVGNRTSAQLNGVNTTYAVNAMNAYSIIASNTTIALSYDGNGNVIADDRNTYSYDPENKLTSVNNGVTAIYLYDALGRRVLKAVSGDTIHYLYDGQQVIEERNRADSVAATYVWGSWIDDIVSMTRKGNIYYYHTNTIGSVVSITDSTGAVVERYDYDSWGNLAVYDGAFSPLVASAIGNSYTFTGRQYEWETGFYFYRSRNYDPEHGRFLQRDPQGYVDGLGLYAYVSNMPSVLIDPSGMEGIDWCGAWEEYVDNTSEFFGGLKDAAIDLVVGLWQLSTHNIWDANFRKGFVAGIRSLTWQGVANASLQYISNIPNLSYRDAGALAINFLPGFGELKAAKAATAIKFTENAFDITAKAVKYADEVAKSGETLFHYTSEAGYKAIMESGELLPSIGVKNARYGAGQYLTDIAPGQFTIGQTSRRLFGVPWNKTSLTHFIEIDVSGLNIIKNAPYNYLIPGTESLSLTRRIINGGVSKFR